MHESRCPRYAGPVPDRDFITSPIVEGSVPPIPVSSSRPQQITGEQQVIRPAPSIMADGVMGSTACTGDQGRQGGVALTGEFGREQRAAARRWQQTSLPVALSRVPCRAAHTRDAITAVYRLLPTSSLVMRKCGSFTRLALCSVHSFPHALIGESETCQLPYPCGHARESQPVKS